MISDLLRFKKNQVYSFWDYETEDLRLNGNRPWQLSWIVASQEKVISSFDRYIWWDDLQISSGAAIATRFNYDHYSRNAKPPEQVLEEFEHFLYDKRVLNVGANIYGFDFFVHNTFREQCGKKPDYSFQYNSLCIQSIEKAIFLGRKSFSDDPIKRCVEFYNLANMNLSKKIKVTVEKLAKSYNIPYDPLMAHDALYDNGLVRSIFNKQIYQIDI